MKIDAYDSPDAEALLQVGKERRNRPLDSNHDLATQVIAAVAFIASAVLIAVVAPWPRSLSVVNLALVLLVWVIVDRVKFPVGGGWTYPTLLVFVPALFLLPTPVVPLIVALAILIGGVPAFVRGQTPLTHLPSDIADAWYTIGPTLVIVLAGAERFAWSHWPVYVGALFAQVLFDMAATVSRCWFGEGIKPRVQLPLLVWLYIVDAALAPLGLLIAAAAVNRPGLVLLALSPIAMLWLFAHERQQRMDETLALSSAYRGTALLLGDVVEADDHYTGVHSRDVVELSIAVADQLGLDARQKRHVEFAALLHDVGKIRVPKEIINKPGALDEAEWSLMRRHTIDGEQMLEQVGGLLADVGHIVRASHEHYDGSGYPDRRAGETIPIEARIVCACDAYSAMTTDRSYRSAMSADEALAEMIRCAGTHFDPDVAAAIERLRRPEAPLPEPVVPEPVVDEPKFQPWNVLGVPKLSPRPVGPSRPQQDCLSSPEPLPM
jgi:HD-GYP domain-containing protein (c-di-GMP phosphodiesterase class II)